MGHYETLNVSVNSTHDEIKKSYRRLVKKHHPDVGGDAANFKKISEAYGILGNPETRKNHDARSYSSNQSGSWEDLFNRYDYAGAFDQSFDPSAKGRDVRVSLNITIEESYEGTRRYIDVGTGGFNINIPKGIPNGTKLRVADRGQRHQTNSTARPGDLIVTINLIFSTDLTVNGNDIFVDLDLEWIDIILGGEFEVKTKVHTVKIKVPRGSYDSKILRVTGKGMPIYNKEGFGNMMVKLRMLPVQLTEEQTSILLKIKEL